MLKMSRRSQYVLSGITFFFTLCPPIFANNLQTAKQHYKNKNYLKALKTAKALKTKTPKNADVLGLIGQIHFALGQYDKANPYLDKAAALEPLLWSGIEKDLNALTAFTYGDDKKVSKTVSSMDDSWVRRELPLLLQPEGMKARKTKKGRYVIYTDATLRRSRGDVYIARLMDMTYNAYSKVFPFKKNPKVINRIYIFSSSAAYNQFNSALGRDMSHAAGYFSPSTKILVVNADPRGARTNPYGLSADAVNTLFHEGFHQFIHMFAPNIPLWFNEGLAEYFGPSQFLGKKKLKVGIVEKNDPRFVTRYQRIRESILQRVPLAPLAIEDFISPKNASFKGAAGRSNVSYAQAWSFVHFLLHSKSMGRKGKKLIKKYFTMLKSGHSIDEAHKATFAKLNLRKIDKAWRLYVLNL
jgi:tetratricopeptide (TPR) repeat protein